MHEAEMAVVWDAHLGGWPVSLIGIESRPLPRHGAIPADGPEQWTSGTLFPRASKKIARAINAASSRRPVVVLANLAGFDGSPESMRKWELEFGANRPRRGELRRLIVFYVVSRYHGGAFVVFSKLSPSLETVLLEGARLGDRRRAGCGRLRARCRAGAATSASPLDERIAAAEGRPPAPAGAPRRLWSDVLAEKRGEFGRVRRGPASARCGWSR
jgi:hypothetical protein